ncbi:YrhK family protein [Thalassobaculum sp. OXR-137]|uniref:YrhK family protein n=1 Tax=Thalassobaculum sp. OXR-137 TaxID=3100173 RepID=UPI002AC98E77|nr:YrhK family protein [Thalassobaculum sp. OXR-137]WPZ36984.1 YrhK family protein [Thalassobaculum sp. OXR-137]
MPHFFSNRQRSHALVPRAGNRGLHFRWETANAMVYTAGGVIFIAGSVCFFPSLSAWQDLGAGAFLAGSLLYLLVTGHDMVEVVACHRQRGWKRSVWSVLEFWAAVSYLVGTLLFVGGSVCFFPEIGWAGPGAWSFLVGSALFLFGAVVNVLQIVFAATMKTLQLLNLTAISFIVGSTLFCVASIPFLWDLRSEADRLLLDGYLAWLFLSGSVLFLAGGLLNYWRAWLVVRSASQAEASA